MLMLMLMPMLMLVPTPILTPKSSDSSSEEPAIINGSQTL